MERARAEALVREGVPKTLEVELGDGEKRRHILIVFLPADGADALGAWPASVLAIDARCGHQGAPLELGDVEDLGSEHWCVRCPWHNRQFCLRTGREVFSGVVSAALAQRPHEAEWRSDGVYLRLGEALDAFPSEEHSLARPGDSGRVADRRPRRSTLEALLAQEARFGFAEPRGREVGETEGPAYIHDEFLF